MKYLSITKTMEQPQVDWWQPLIKWIATNTVAFLAVGTTWKFIDGMFKFLTKLIDGRLKKISETAIDEKMAPLTQKVDDLKDQIDNLTKIIISKK